MARKMKSEPIKRAADGLEEPFPAAPSRLAKHVIYAYRTDGTHRMICMTFCADYAAKKFLDILLNGEDYKWLKETVIGGDSQLMTARDIKVRGRTLEDLIEYEYSDAERYWELPEPHSTQARQILQRSKNVEVDEETGAIVKVEKPKKEPKQKIDRTGKVSIQDIAEQLGCTPKEARGSLRKAKIDKPAGGWLFDPARAEEIKALVKKGLK